MAEDIVTPERLAAGRDYLAALTKLGLQPDALLWTIGEGKNQREDLQLSLVTSLVDIFGPKEIYELLYMAFENAGTPKNIDPWVVSLYGQGSDFAVELATGHVVSAVKLRGISLDGDPYSKEVSAWTRICGRLFLPDWVYVRKHRSKDGKRARRTMVKFRANVEALAA